MASSAVSLRCSFAKGNGLTFHEDGVWRGGAHMLMEYTKDNSLGQDVLGSSNTAFQPVW